MAMEVTCRTVGLVVNAPELFQREDFFAWMTDPSRPTATWHRGDKPGDYSDVFVLVDSDFDGDSSDMPEDAWRAICQLAYDVYCDGRPELPRHIESAIVVRLTNLE